MASSGQKFNKYSIKKRNKIMKKYDEGEPISKLSKEYNIPLGTIKGWKRKYINYPELYPNAGIGSGNHNNHNGGRTKEKGLTKEDYKERYEILKKYQAFLKEQRERK